MEDVKINLKFTKFIISKMISSLIRKKLKSDVKIKVNDLELYNNNGEVIFSLSVNGSMKEVDFDNLMSKV